MKRWIFILTFPLAAALLSACGGTTSAVKNEQQLAGGMEAIGKGVSRYNHGCFQDAMEYFLRAHELFSVADQPGGVAMSLNNIGNVYRITGDQESAVLFFDESLEIYTGLGDQRGRVQVLANKAAACMEWGRLDRAEEVLNTADGIARKHGIAHAPLARNRGILLLRKKDFGQAEKTLLATLRKTGADPLESGASNYAMATLMLETKRPAEAVQFFENALDADRSSGYYKGVADDLAGLGSAWSAIGENGRAVDFFKRSIKIYALINSKKNVETTLQQLENLSEKTGADIRVTAHFVSRWLKGEVLERHCR